MKNSWYTLYSSIYIYDFFPAYIAYYINEVLTKHEKDVYLVASSGGAVQIKAHEKVFFFIYSLIVVFQIKHICLAIEKNMYKLSKTYVVPMMNGQPESRARAR